ncbi:MAG: RusA family crossover junction endodeoxyribonuclease [Candidatus Limnocylindrus sp.]
MTVRKLMFAAWVPVPPQAKGRPRFARATGRAFTPATTAAAERTMRGELAAGTKVGELARQQVWPLEGALELHVDCVLPIPQSWSKRKQEEARRGLLRHTSRPDVDNLGKLVMDAANGVLWKDDSQLISVTFEKMYGPSPGTAVTLYRPAEAT